MLRKYKPFALGLALTALLAGCAQTPDPGVRLRSVSTDLGLGLIRDVRRESLPPLPELGELPDPPRPPFNSQKPKPVCPEAGLFEFADAEAGPTISARPLVGDYRWKYRLNVIDPERAEPFVGGAAKLALRFAQRTEELQKGSLEFFGNRSVDALNPDLAEAATTATGSTALVRDSYQFTVSETFGVSPWPTIHNLGGGDRIRVQPASYGDTTNTQRDEGEGVSIFFTAWGESEDIDGFPENLRAWLMPLVGTSAGGPVNTNSPEPPQGGGPHLHLIHFPVAAGQTIFSVARGQGVNPAVLAGDPNAVTQLGPRYDILLEGRVVGRRQIDACGEMVDGWYVDGKITLIRNGGSPLVMDYDYEIAPQMGGMIIYQRWAFPFPEGTTGFSAPDPAYVIEASIGQAKPADD